MKRTTPRFKVGDVLEVTVYDLGDDVWEHGTVIIDKYARLAPYTKYGVYGFKYVKGDFKCHLMNAAHFDDEMYTVWLGNVEDDPVVRILYGSI